MSGAEALPSENDGRPNLPLAISRLLIESCCHVRRRNTLRIPVRYAQSGFDCVFAARMHVPSKKDIPMNLSVIEIPSTVSTHTCTREVHLPRPLGTVP
jgi:hypothetical protein